MSCNNTDTDNCGCSHQHSAKCSFYYGDALSCIDVVYGDNLQTVIENINTAVCNLTPSGSVAIVESCNTNITVTPVTVGQTTTYTVCLNSDITDNIQTNSDNISTINTCLSNTVADLTSSDGSIYIEEISSDACGRVLNLTTTTPSGTPYYDGLVIDDTTGYSPNGSGGAQVVYINTEDYYTKSLITTQDRIIYIFSGVYTTDNVNGSDIVDIKFFNGATQKFHLVSTAPSSEGSEVKSGYHVEFILTIKDATDVTNATVQVTAFWYTNLTANGAISYNSTSISQSIFNYVSTGIDLTALKCTVTYTNNSLLTGTYNKLNLISSEVTKKI